MNSIADLLLQAQSQHSEVSKNALVSLAKYSQSNPSSFYLDLSKILFEDSIPKNTRSISGMYIKNTIFEYWDLISNEIAQQIKNNCLGTLATQDLDIVKIGAICVSKLALLEFPKGRWKDLLDILTQNAHNVQIKFKLASLLTIGFISEDLDSKFLTTDEKNRILTATISNLSSNEPNLQSISLNALRNSLKFYQINFKNPSECQMILREICSTFQSFPELCLQILCDIILNYPEAFCESLQLIWSITYTAMQTKNKNIVILGIEVWISIAEVEKSRIDEGLTSFGYIETAAESLVELLLPKLVYPCEEDEWTESKASYTALTCMFQICGQKLLPRVQRFIIECFKETNELKVQAGLLALASIFEDSLSISSEISALCQKVIEHMASNNYAIKKNALWCFGKICDSFPRIFEKCDVIHSTEILFKTITNLPALRNITCWCLNSIFEKCTDYFDLHMYDNSIKILLGLIKLNAPNAEKIEICNLLCTMIEKIPKAYSNLLEKHFEDILTIYTSSLENFNENMHTCTSSVLQICCAILPVGKIPKPKSDFIVNSVLTLFLNHGKIFEEGLQLLGALSMNLGENFYPYLHKVSSYVMYALTQLNASGILKSGIMAISDFSRSLNMKIVDYICEIVPLLIKILENPEVCVTSKVLCINCLGDIAGAVKGNFISYLDVILSYLDTAAGISLSISEDPDVNENLVELRECILQFYIGLIQGLSESGKQEHIRDRIPKILSFICIIVSEKYFCTETLHEAALGLIGDISEKYQEPKLVSKLEPYVKNFLSVHGDLNLLARWILSMNSRPYLA